MNNQLITKTAKLIETEVLAFQDHLVRECVNSKILHVNDVPNGRYGWYLITKRLSEKLIQKNQHVLIHDYGIWWARKGLDRKLVDDPILQKIVVEAENEQGDFDTVNPIQHSLLSAVIACQGRLVNECLWKRLFKHEEIRHRYSYIDKEGNWLPNQMIEKAKKLKDFEKKYLERYKLTYGWHLVEDWLADLLELEYEPILRNTFGIWWGKTHYTKELIEDPILQKISHNIYADKREKN